LSTLLITTTDHAGRQSWQLSCVQKAKEGMCHSSTHTSTQRPGTSLHMISITSPSLTFHREHFNPPFPN